MASDIPLSVRELEKSSDGRTLFSDLSFGIEAGERLAIIGPNGSGKSTLLRLLTGEEEPDRGLVARRRGLVTGRVGQNDVAHGPEGQSIRAWFHKAVGEGPEGLPEYEQEMHLEQAGVTDLDKAVNHLSGGWKKRLAILAVACKEPEILFLDEPTNHLDLEGIWWLEDLLKEREGSAVFVTHDRRFLEQTATRIFEINPRHPKGFYTAPGPYSRFLEHREEFWAGEASRRDALANTVRREIEWLRRGAKARTTKQQARIQRAGELQESLSDLQGRTRAQGVGALDFTAGEGGRRLLEAEGLTASMGPRTLGPVDLFLLRGERLGILGSNGSGKSTLLRLLAGEQAATGGRRWSAENLRIVHFTQHRESLPLDITLGQALCPAGGDQVIYQDRPIHVTAWARRFHFEPNQLTRVMGKFSGGEQARVVLARLMLKPADLLLLDEPTNDLDLATLEILEERLLEFPGALLMVSHDRYLLDRVCQRLVAVGADGKVSHWADLDQWEEASRNKSKTAEPAKGSKPTVVEAPPLRPLSGSERVELKNMEAKILAAEEAVAKAEADLADPSVASNGAELMARQKVLDGAQETLQKLFDRWADLEARGKANG